MRKDMPVTSLVSLGTSYPKNANDKLKLNYKFGYFMIFTFYFIL